MVKLLEQAQLAAETGDWAQLNNCLQQMLLHREVNESAPRPGFGTLLSLAFAVLEAGDFQDRWEVAKLFPAMGNVAIAPLITLFSDDSADLEARWFAIRILPEFNLAEFNLAQVAIALVKVIQTTEHDELSQVAAETLTKLGTPAIVALVDLLAKPETRLSAVRSLALIQHPATIDPLLAVVTDPQPMIRTLAIEALGSSHDPRIPPVLLDALSDTAATVRRAAVTALSVRTDLVVPLDLVKRLTDRLWDFNLEVCQQAAIALGRFGNNAAVAPLLYVLLAPTTPLPLQLETARSIAWIGTAPALNALQQALQNLSQTVNTQAIAQEIVMLIGRWSDRQLSPQATQVLIDILQLNQPASNDPRFKQAIALSLGQLQHPHALEPLTQFLADTDMGVRLHAIAALKALDPQSAHQRLTALAQQCDVSESLRQGVAIALKEW